MFFETKNIDVEHKHNLKSGTNNDKKGFQRENKTGKRRERVDDKKEKSFVVEYFDVGPFMKQKQRRQKKQRKRQKQGTKRKQTRKTRRKNEGK